LSVPHNNEPVSAPPPPGRAHYSWQLLKRRIKDDFLPPGALANIGSCI
jgi:hypothetical protein